MTEYIVNLDGELGMALAVACTGGGFVRGEIVRCRDCNNLIIGKCPCEFFALEDLDGFCAWAKRKIDKEQAHL